VLKGKDLFDARLFSDATSTAIFYTFMAELRQVIDNATTTATHHFIKYLFDKKKVLRCYTQNIDCLETRLGLSCELNLKSKSATQIVQLHGDMKTVICTLCRQEFEFKQEHLLVFKEGRPPPCLACEEHSDERSRLGKRPVKCGTLRPNIILYNEYHSQGKMSKC
jgi:NAD-dependent histone deacetylase SIR2